MQNNLGDMIKKFLLFSILIFVFSLGLLFTASNYLHDKMKEELPTYYSLTSQMETLNDLYYLCSGLLSSNPSKKNIDSCNLVFLQIEQKTIQIKEKCPYISFYITYLK